MRQHRQRPRPFVRVVMGTTAYGGAPGPLGNVPITFSKPSKSRQVYSSSHDPWSIPWVVVMLVNMKAMTWPSFLASHATKWPSRPFPWVVVTMTRRELVYGHGAVLVQGWASLIPLGLGLSLHGLIHVMHP